MMNELTENKEETLLTLFFRPITYFRVRVIRMKKLIDLKFQNDNVLRTE